MEPKHTTPGIERLVLDKANSIAFCIEATVEDFARSQYKFKCEIKRYTELIWYCSEKTFLGSGSMLFMVGLGKNDSDALESVCGLKKGDFFIRVYFLETDEVARKSIPSASQRREFTKTIEATVGLPCLYIGSRGLIVIRQCIGNEVAFPGSALLGK